MSGIGTYLLRFMAVVGCAAVAYCIYSTLFGTPVQPVEAQNDRYLESRLNQIEQRFYMLESRLNRIEQDSISRRSSATTALPDTRSQDINLLQNELAGLRLRVGEVECGVLKLDERTLTAAKRLGGRSATGSDRCRQDWSSPVQLSARP